MNNSLKQTNTKIKWSAISDPVIFRGDASTAYRDPAVLYHDGRFHMYFTLSKIESDGQMFLRVFPDKPVTKKPAETRMGKGKGSVELWVAPVKRGRVMFEISGLDEVTAKKVLHLAAGKLPIRTRFVRREEKTAE